MLALLGLAAGASARVAPEPSAARRFSFVVPAGDALVGEAVGGAWTWRVAPLDAGAASPTGVAECYDDAHPDGGSAPAPFPLSPNPTFPAFENMASQGGCEDWATYAAPVTLLEFQSFGDIDGGSTHLSGVDASGEPGTLDVHCSPAGSEIGVGAGPVWWNVLSVDNAECDATEHGPEPSSYASWSGYVVNDNEQQGSATYVVAR